MSATNTTSTTKNNNQPLAGYKCLVTGASSGIGRATCILLTAQGAQVIGVGRNQAALKELQEEQGGIQGSVVVELTKEGASQRTLTEAVEQLGGSLTTLVNCAGVLKGGPAGGVDLQNYHFNMSINTQVPFELMMAAIPYLEAHPNQASIVNVSSVNGKQAFA